jgi:hypothetical protein
VRLRKGDVLVKKRGGATRRMQVSARWKAEDGWRVELLPLAPSTARRARDKVVSRVLPLCEDGLPEGYRREVAP